MRLTYRSAVTAGATAALVLTGLGVGPARAATSETVYLTGYSLEDNTPSNSRIIAGSGEAGGSGTWDDPITMAVGMGWEYPQGTKWYLPALQLYAEAQDLCGSCGAGKDGLPWIDLFVGSDPSGSCMGSITGQTAVIRYTPEEAAGADPGQPVVPRPNELAAACSTSGAAVPAPQAPAQPAPPPIVPSPAPPRVEPAGPSFGEAWRWDRPATGQQDQQGRERGWNRDRDDDDRWPRRGWWN